MIKMQMIFDEWVAFVKDHPESFRLYALNTGMDIVRIEKLIRKVVNDYP